MNDVTFVEASRVLAQKIMKEPADARLSSLFRTVLSRKPSEIETKALQKSFEKYRAHFENDPPAAAKLLSTGDAPQASGADTAAWTMVASLILNLDEAVTKE
jgi:hypothetical protein